MASTDAPPDGSLLIASTFDPSGLAAPLDAWLRLCFLPALRGAGKGLSLDVGAPQAPIFPDGYTFSLGRIFTRYIFT